MWSLPMNYRTRYRVSSVPLFVVSACLCMLLALTRPIFRSWLDEQVPNLAYMALGVGVLLPLVFSFWYLSSYAQVRHGWFTVRSMLHRQRTNLKALAYAEVYPKARRRGRKNAYDMILRLEDAEGRQVWLPLNSWRDEDLLMARLLRATVECRVTIEGDPLQVKRFGRLLDSYKSWERRLTAA